MGFDKILTFLIFQMLRRQVCLSCSHTTPEKKKKDLQPQNSKVTIYTPWGVVHCNKTKETYPVWDSCITGGGGGLSMIFLGKLNMHKQFIWCFKLSILQLFLYKDLEKILIQLMKRFILSTEIRSFGGLNIYTNEEACQSTLTFVSNRNTLTLILHLLGHQLELQSAVE